LLREFFMVLRKLKSKGLAHLSHLAGSGGEAAAVDPRLDSEVYDGIAREEGLRITTVSKTHGTASARCPHAARSDVP
jgi:hydroxyacylglutathione hydrolase